MPSPRSRLETACRIGAFGLLGWLRGGSVFPSNGRRVEIVRGTESSERFAEFARARGNVSLHAELIAAPDAWVSDWLAALRRSGRQVTWSGNPPAAALATEPLADPKGGVRIDVAAHQG